MITEVEFKKQWAETMVKGMKDLTVSYEQLAQDIMAPLCFKSEEIEAKNMSFLIATFERAQNLFLKGCFKSMDEALLAAHSIISDDVI